ncbi:hemicentin-2-like isoform X1 [Dendronephthya gigantea]|uniref:hemicentin-2-like isoform X1 n=1 Tax=Dendronephthya gigantea TaxID=151771 RepID=UPI00106D01B2|nr:hemicentin-2-like isoform X1 [Dendronephthya gigantea]
MNMRSTTAYDFLVVVSSKMSDLAFLSIVCLAFMLSQCEGKIFPPPEGTELTFLPGTDGKIRWSFDDDLSSGSFRAWYRRKTLDGKAKLLAQIIDDDSVPSFLAPGYAIEGNATLVIQNVNESHNGIYQFFLGPYQSNVVVFVASKPAVTLSCSSPIATIEGDNITCICQAKDGNPPANVTWYKDGVQITKSEKNRQILNLNNVDKKDSGIYKCIARSYTLADEKSIEVMVYYPVSPAILSLTTTPEDVVIGESVVITCEAIAVPLPSYTIIHNDTKVVSTRKTYIITILKYNDAGSYECIATNQLGKSSKTFNLSVVEIRKTNTPSSKGVGTDKPELQESQNCQSGTEWYIVLVSSVTTFIIGILVSCVVFYFRCKHRSRKRQQNHESPKSQVDKTYQELDLTKMNTGENYQTLTAVPGAAASNESVREDDSTYTELSKTRDIEENYQSLT